jgi:hypothetical protein
MNCRKIFLRDRVTGMLLRPDDLWTKAECEALCFPSSLSAVAFSLSRRLGTAEIVVKLSDQEDIVVPISPEEREGPLLWGNFHSA